MQNDALKLLVALAYSVLVAFTNLEYYYIVPLIVLLLIEKKYLRKIVKKVVLLNVFTIFLAIFVSLQNQQMAIELFIRVNLILFFTTTLFFHSQGFDIVRGLNALRVSPLFVSIFYFTLTVIIFLKNEIKNKKNSLKLRGFKANTSMFSYSTFGNIFALLFIKALKKSQELQYCMQSRGYEGKIYLINSNKVNKADILLCFLIVSMFIIKGVLL